MLNSFDLSPFATGESLPSYARDHTAAAIDETLCETGFLLVTGHGVADNVRHAYFDAMRDFFALPIEQKEAIAIGKSDCHRGYVGFETESLDGALAGGSANEPVAGDLKETLDTGIDHRPDHPEVLTHTVRAVGGVTNAIFALSTGAIVGIRGPFGTSWPTAVGKDLLIIAGGIGLAPVRPLIYKALAHRERHLCLGLAYGDRKSVV